MIDKTWIENNLFTTDKTRMNNHVSQTKWWKNRHLENHYEWIQIHYPFDNILQSLYHIYHSLSRENPKCHCGKNLQFRQFNSGYRYYCSLQCSYVDAKRNTKISKNRDMEAITKKMQETTHRKYGAYAYFATDDFKKKSSNTKLERYNNANYNNSSQRIITNIELYGRSNGNGLRFSNCPTIETLYDMNYIQGLKAHEIASYFNVTQKTIFDWFKRLELEYKIHTPDHQKLQREFSRLLPPGFIVNDRKTIYPLEIDMHYPEQKLAIEINGLYWHSENKMRHLNKLQRCNEKGIALLQFWDYEIIEKPDIVIAIIRHKLGVNKTIGARQCDVVFDVPNKEYKQFMTENHIQGYIPAKIRIGLQYNGHWVAMCGLSKPRFDKSTDLELIRFCNKKETSVVGGLSKMLARISNNSIVSYSDRRIFEGNVHENAGFRHEGVSSPGFFWFKKSERLSRYQCQKHHLPSLLKETYNNTISSSKNMLNNGWRRVYDCGQNKFKREAF